MRKGKKSNTRLIGKITVYNIALFILLLVITAFVAYGLGFRGKRHFHWQVMLLYIMAALVQLIVNYSLFKKELVKNKYLEWIMFSLVILIYLFYYLIYRA
jgi:ABC-type glycerol-3-phosphate transport system permease component